MIHLKITGMTCGHCQRSAKEALESVAGVESAEVSLEDGTAEVTGNPNVDYLIAAIKEEGFSATLAEA